jgi:hypothetical protein
MGQQAEKKGRFGFGEKDLCLQTRGVKEFIVRTPGAKCHRLFIRAHHRKCSIVRIVGGLFSLGDVDIWRFVSDSNLGNGVPYDLLRDLTQMVQRIGVELSNFVTYSQ